MRTEQPDLTAAELSSPWMVIRSVHWVGAGIACPVQHRAEALRFGSLRAASDESRAGPPRGVSLAPGPQSRQASPESGFSLARASFAPPQPSQYPVETSTSPYRLRLGLLVQTPEWGKRPFSLGNQVRWLPQCRRRRASPRRQSTDSTALWTVRGAIVPEFCRTSPSAVRGLA
jgi:hypothetical protein